MQQKLRDRFRCDFRAVHAGHHADLPAFAADVPAGFGSLKRPMVVGLVVGMDAADLQCAVAPVGHMEALTTDVKCSDVFGFHKVFLLALCAV